MAALNFHSRFADDVEAGRKTNSIRKTKRSYQGGLIHLYTGQRTKNCRKLGEATCTKVREIEITPEAVTISIPMERR